MTNFILLSTKIPATWKFYTAYASNITITIPSSGWYRIYCVGKSGDGGVSATVGAGAADGGGGGGSGGMAISNLRLSAGDSIPLTFNNGTAAFGALLSATPGSNGGTKLGGSGGVGVGGDINLNGYKGGDGGAAVRLNSESGWVRSQSGHDGENGGMKGGAGGYSLSPSQPGGGGAGGGARLPGGDICPYIAPAYTNSFTAAMGGHQNNSEWNVTNSDPYPPPILNASIKIYGAGGGQGGRGYFWDPGGNLSSGTPAVIIIEIPA